MRNLASHRITPTTTCDEREITIENLWWDGLYMHHTLDPSAPHSLAFCASVDTREPYWKDEAKDPDEAVKIITVGAPEIAALSRESVRLEGGEEVVVTGGNFSPEAEVVLGDRHVSDFMVESGERFEE